MRLLPRDASTLHCGAPVSSCAHIAGLFPQQLADDSSRPVDHRVLPPAANGSNPVVAPNLTDAPSPYIPPTGCTLTPRGLGLGQQ